MTNFRPVYLGFFLLLTACGQQLERQPDPEPPVPSAAPAVAQSAGNPPVLAGTPLGRALRESLASGPTLASGRAGEAAARARVNEAESALRPSVSLAASTGVSTSDSAGFSPEVVLTQRVYDGGAARSSIEAANAGERAAGAETEVRLTERALEGIRAWEELELAERLLEVATASISLHDDVMTQIEQRVSSGAGTMAELLSVASRRADAMATLARAEGRLAQAAARAVQIFGRQPNTGPLPAAPEPIGGLDSAPTLAALRAEVEVARSRLEARRAERAPGIFFNITGGLDADDQPELGAGLRMEYAIDTSGRRAAAMEAAAAELEQSLADYEFGRRDLERAVADAVIRQRSLEGEARAASIAEEASREALRTSQEGFVTGRASVLDLLDRARDLNSASIRRAEVSSARRVAGYERLAVTGNLLDVFGISPTTLGSAQ